MSPTTGLGAHAHSATDRPQGRAQQQGPGTGPLATESQHPQHPAVQKPGKMGKQDSQRLGAHPQEHGGAVPTRSGDGTRRAPPRQGETSTVAMIVLESGHYYQVRITAHLQECHWSLEAVNSMILASAALLDSSGPLPNDQPPDPLTAIVLGTAGTWHRGHALYCLWRWAQRS